MTRGDERGEPVTGNSCVFCGHEIDSFVQGYRAKACPRCPRDTGCATGEDNCCVARGSKNGRRVSELLAENERLRGTCQYRAEPSGPFGLAGGWCATHDRGWNQCHEGLRAENERLRGALAATIEELMEAPAHDEFAELIVALRAYVPSEVTPDVEGATR